MTSKILLGLLLAPLAGYSQTSLTGAGWFASSPTGGTSVSQGYSDGFSNTLGGDQWWNLWFALKPDASFPLNGPSDAQAGIDFPLLVGQRYKYYMFVPGPCCTLAYTGLNLFFDGNSSNPGISVFGPVGTSNFIPNGNSSTFSLPGDIVPGAGRSFYTSGDVTVLLTEYSWNDSATPPGNVCQPFTFAPDSDGDASEFGSLTLQIWRSATLSPGAGSGSPFSKLTLTGSGFDANEIISIYAGQIGAVPLVTTNADSTGSFAVSTYVPQRGLGPVDFYAVGASSLRLGATSFYVDPAMAVTPRNVVPGGSTSAHLVGFAAGEAVDIYWNEPRQLLGTATSDLLGSGIAAVTVPSNSALGENIVFGVGQTSQAVGGGTVDVQ